ncbi:MAG: hypothetical protein J5J00_06385 [Deltaproteobacteria bacterium]|nr:hypothetical protein [Deltaproteobacteria bacterium]
MSAALVVFVLFAGFIAATSLRVVPKGQVFIKERLGRQSGELKPGIHFIFPLIDRTIRQESGPASKSFQFGRVKVSIGYEIEDGDLLRRSVADIDSALRMGAEARLKKYLGDDLSRAGSVELSRVKSDFARDMTDLFHPWGVKVRDVELVMA